MPLHLWIILLVVLPATCSALLFWSDARQKKKSKTHFETVVLPNRIESELRSHENRSAHWHG